MTTLLPQLLTNAVPSDSDQEDWVAIGLVQPRDIAPQGHV